jgi:hypothetical protein
MQQAKTTLENRGKGTTERDSSDPGPMIIQISDGTFLPYITYVDGDLSTVTQNLGRFSTRAKAMRAYQRAAFQRWGRGGLV